MVAFGASKSRQHRTAGIAPRDGKGERSRNSGNECEKFIIAGRARGHGSMHTQSPPGATPYGRMYVLVPLLSTRTCLCLVLLLCSHEASPRMCVFGSHPSSCFPKCVKSLSGEGQSGCYCQKWVGSKTVVLEFSLENDVSREEYRTCCWCQKMSGGVLPPLLRNSRFNEGTLLQFFRPRIIISRKDFQPYADIVPDFF